MGIPVGETFHISISGQRDKRVDCEECGHEYYYRMSKEVTGQGFSFLFLDSDGAKQRAEQDAVGKLDSVLTNGAELVPCPRCGRYQQNMLSLAMSKYFPAIGTLTWVLVIGAVLGLIGAFVVLLSSEKKELPAWAVLGPMGALLIAVLMPLLRWCLSRMCDPNNEPVSERLQVASMSLAKFRSDKYPLETSMAASNSFSASHPTDSPLGGVITDMNASTNADHLSSAMRSSRNVSDLPQSDVEVMRQSISTSDV